MMDAARWKAGVKRFLFWLFYYSGLELLVARCIKIDAAAVIMYHGVCNDSRLPPEVDFHLTADAFEEKAVRINQTLSQRLRIVRIFGNDIVLAGWSWIG